ncbi:MAG: hypothetical protein AMK72_07040, partial [Planctomycetes bacterium SM23_25]
VLGGPLAVEWTVRNADPLAPAGGRIDRIWLSAHAILDGDDVLLAEVAGGPLGAGADDDSSHTVTLPLDHDVPEGDYYLVVEANADGAVRETHHNNNANHAGPVTLTLPDLPDLAVSGVAVDAEVGLAGHPVEFTWTLTNAGTLALEGTWNEKVYLSTDAVAGDDTPLATFSYSGPLAPGETLVRAETLTLPAISVYGDLYAVVVADPQDLYFEPDEANNAGVASEPLSVPLKLALEVPVEQIEEAGAPVQAFVSRGGPINEPLVVYLSTLGSGGSPDATEISIPATVTLEAGERTAAFTITPLDDGVVDGLRSVVIFAEADAEDGDPYNLDENGVRDGLILTGQVGLDVLDSDEPSIGITLSVDQAIEGGTVMATVTADPAPIGDLAVQVFESPGGRIAVPDGFFVPSGETSATFEIVLPEDALVEAYAEVTILVVAAGYGEAEAALGLIDNDAVSLSLDIEAASVVESAFGAATWATVTRDLVTDAPLTVLVESSDVTAARALETVLIPAGAAEARFPIAAVNDDLVDGMQTAVFTVRPADPYTGEALGMGEASDALDVLDDDGPTLSVRLDASLLAEDGTVGATVSRNTADTSQPVTVTLSSSDVGEATVPIEVVIPAGETGVDFVVSGVVDGVVDGNQPVTISASAAGFNAGSASLYVTDTDLPDLRVVALTVPATVLTDRTFEVSWTVRNEGLSDAGGAWEERVYYSPDGQLYTEGLLGTFVYDTPLPPGQSYERNATFDAPDFLGSFYVMVIVDPLHQVGEAVEDNNLAFAPNLLEVVPSYQASVSADVSQVLPGAPILLRGVATEVDTGDPAAFKTVTVRILHKGTRRTLTAVTSALGEFETTFQPLRSEAGFYQVAAGHPQVRADTPQDSFVILGLAADPRVIQHTMLVGDLVSGSVQLRNLSDVPLEGLTVTPQDVPEGVEVRLDLSHTVLPGSGAVALAYEIEAAGPSPYHAWNLRVTTAEGITVDVPVGTQVKSLVPVLEGPGRLTEGMIRGERRVVEFVVTNTGGAATGPMAVELPGVGWMRVAGANPLGSLAPGETAAVSLVLDPPADLPLGAYNGTIALTGEGVGLGIPFSFTCVSDGVGDVAVTVVDEATYHGDGQGVLGATVTLRNPFTGQAVATATTDETGEVRFTDVPEATYTLDVSARKHRSHSSSLTIVPGQEVARDVFLQMELVTYNWSVEEIEVEERFEIRLDTVFETAVPVAVVTIDPPIISLADVGDQAQVNLTITNHGLIAAENVSLRFPEHPEWELVPLVEEIGRLNARSSVTVPVFIRRLAPGEGGGATVDAYTQQARDEFEAAFYTGTPGDWLILVGRVAWDIICGIINSTHGANVNVTDRAPGGGGDDWDISGILDGMWSPDLGGVEDNQYLEDLIDLLDGPGNGAYGPGTGGTGVTITYPPSNPSTGDGTGGGSGWCSCDPKTYTPKKLTGEAAVDAGPVLNWLKDYILAYIPSVIKPQGPIVLKGKLVGSIGTCCGGGQIGLVVDGGFNIESKLTLRYGANAPGFSKRVEVAGHILDVGFGFFGGVEFGLSQTFHATIKTECHLQNPVLCAGATLRFEVKPMIEVSGGAKALINGELIEFKAMGQMGVDTGVTITMQGCIGDPGKPFTTTVQFDGVSVFGTVELVGGKYSTKWGVHEQLIGPWPASAAEAAAGAMPALELTPDDLARMFGYASAAHLVADYSGGYVPAAAYAGPMTNEELAAALVAAEKVRQAAADGRVRVAYSVRAADEDDDEAVCAQVAMRLDQQGALTRKIFAGTLDLTNNSTQFALEDLSVRLNIYDAEGQLANDRFIILEPELTNITVTDDGSPPPGYDPLVDPPYFGHEAWELAADSTGRIRWTIIPDDSAAVDGPEQYRVGGFFNYTLNGQPTSGILTPCPITVYPNAELALKYFIQRDVYSDDPFTDEVEPSEPFSLGVMVTNEGMGRARGFTLTGAEPTIVDNYKGLAVDFDIIATEIDGVALSPSLTARFGHVEPGETLVGRWLMTSNLQGHFTEYEASFMNVDDRGEWMPSLVRSVDIYQLIHVVEAGGLFQDDRYDFLTNDIPDDTYEPVPDTLHLSDGTVMPVALGESLDAVVLPLDYGMQADLDVLMPDEWGYLRIEDPVGGEYRLASVVRLDAGGSEIGEVPVDANAWQTDRSYKEQGARPVYEDLLHILDHGAAAAYRLYYEPVDQEGPEVEELQAVPPVVVQPVADLDVTFSEALEAGSFDPADVTLMRDGAPVDTSGLSIEETGEAAYRITGLGALTDAEGTYRLTVDATGVRDAYGNAGEGDAVVEWVKAAAAPTVLAIQDAPSGTVAGTPGSLYVTFSVPLDAASFDLSDLSLTRDGGANLIGAGVTISRVSDETYRVAGLGDVAADEGTYTFTVDATGVTNQTGTPGVGQASAVWTVDTTGPAVKAIRGLAGLMNKPVSAVEVEFSEVLGGGTFGVDDLALLRDGSPVSLGSGVAVTRVSGATWRIAGLGTAAAQDGAYELRVDLAGVTDAVGNRGSGTVAAGWVLDATPPAAPTNLSVTPDTGVSAADGRTRALDVTIAGTLAEEGLSVRL